MFPYINFLLRSTNQYGVHSPFVYAYLTKCLYTKPRLSKNKTQNLVLKSIAYFNCRRLALFGKPIPASKIGGEARLVQDRSQLVDLLFFDGNHPWEKQEVLTTFKLHSESLIVLGGIYKNNTRLRYWETLCAKDRVVVSIDFHCCGVLFFRKGQKKQHFIIRL